MTKFNVPDMSCNHFTATIKKAIAEADATADLEFDLDAHSVKVTGKLDDAALAAIMPEEGYPATSHTKRSPKSSMGVRRGAHHVPTPASHRSRPFRVGSRPHRGARTVTGLGA